MQTCTLRYLHVVNSTTLAHSKMFFQQSDELNGTFLAPINYPIFSCAFPPPKKWNWLFLWPKPVFLAQAEAIFQVRVSRPACLAALGCGQRCLCSHWDAPCFPPLLSLLSPAAAHLCEPVPGHPSHFCWAASAHTLLLRLWIMAFAVPALTIWELFNCVFHSAWIKGE